MAAVKDAFDQTTTAAKSFMATAPIGASAAAGGRAGARAGGDAGADGGWGGGGRWSGKEWAGSAVAARGAQRACWARACAGVIWRSHCSRGRAAQRQARARCVRSADGTGPPRARTRTFVTLSDPPRALTRRSQASRRRSSPREAPRRVACSATSWAASPRTSPSKWRTHRSSQGCPRRLRCPYVASLAARARCAPCASAHRAPPRRAIAHLRDRPRAPPALRAEPRLCLPARGC